MNVEQSTMATDSLSETKAPRGVKPNLASTDRSPNPMTTDKPEGVDQPWKHPPFTKEESAQFRAERKEAKKPTREYVTASSGGTAGETKGLFGDHKGFNVRLREEVSLKGRKVSPPAQPAGVVAKRQNGQNGSKNGYDTMEGWIKASAGHSPIDGRQPKDGATEPGAARELAGVGVIAPGSVTRRRIEQGPHGGGASGGGSTRANLGGPNGDERSEGFVRIKRLGEPEDAPPDADAERWRKAIEGLTPRIEGEASGVEDGEQTRGPDLWTDLGRELRSGPTIAPPPTVGEPAGGEEPSVAEGPSIEPVPSDAGASATAPPAAPAEAEANRNLDRGSQTSEPLQSRINNVRGSKGRIETAGLSRRDRITANPAVRARGQAAAETPPPALSDVVEAEIARGPEGNSILTPDTGEVTGITPVDVLATLRRFEPMPPPPPSGIRSEDAGDISVPGTLVMPRPRPAAAAAQNVTDALRADAATAVTEPPEQKSPLKRFWSFITGGDHGAYLARATVLGGAVALAGAQHAGEINPTDTTSPEPGKVPTGWVAQAPTRETPTGSAIVQPPAAAPVVMPPMKGVPTGFPSPDNIVNQGVGTVRVEPTETLPVTAEVAEPGLTELIETRTRELIIKPGSSISGEMQDAGMMETQEFNASIYTDVDAAFAMVVLNYEDLVALNPAMPPLDDLAMEYNNLSTDVEKQAFLKKLANVTEGEERGYLDNVPPGVSITVPEDVEILHEISRQAKEAMANAKTEEAKKAAFHTMREEIRMAILNREERQLSQIANNAINQAKEEGVLS